MPPHFTHLNPIPPPSSSSYSLLTSTILQEHEDVKDKIRTILNSYDEFAEEGSALSDTTSKYQLDSLFEDFEGIVVRENDTLVGIHDNLKKSEVKGSAVIQDIEKDLDKAPQTLEMSNRAREALHSSLCKIASAMRNKTSLSASELEALQSEMQKAFDTISTLEEDCQKHLGALGAKTKEYNKYREHSQKKMKGMDDSFNHRMNEMMMELRQTEINVRTRKALNGGVKETSSALFLSLSLSHTQTHKHTHVAA